MARAYRGAGLFGAAVIATSERLRRHYVEQNPAPPPGGSDCDFRKAEAAVFVTKGADLYSDAAVIATQKG